MTDFGTIPSALDDFATHWYAIRKAPKAKVVNVPRPTSVDADQRFGPRKRVLQPTHKKSKNAISQAARVVENERVAIPELRVAEVIEFVARAMQVDPKRILSQSHRRVDTWPRQVAMALAINVTNRKLIKVSRAFGRHHSTVLHAQRAVRTRCETSQAFAVEFENLRLALATHAAQRVARLQDGTS